jgi:hypothetical protein
MASMSESQTLRSNTWTPLLGTDTEVLIDGISCDVVVQAERYHDRNGQELLQFSWAMPSGERIAIRAPDTTVTWIDTIPDDRPEH